MPVSVLCAALTLTTLCVPVVSSSAEGAESTSGTYAMTVNPSPTTGADGTVYQARQGFEGGRYVNTLYRAGADIRGTTDDALYHPEWCVASAWRKSVPNGTYDITLKMREAWYSYPGQRLFSVDAEGTRVLSDIDILKAVGKHTAYDRAFRVDVRDGRLDLGFTSPRGGAVVSAIVVKPVAAPTGTPTPTPTPTATPTPTPTPTATPTAMTPTPSGVTGAWTLSMRDEFDGSTLNTSLWTPHRGLAPYTYGHPYNASLDDYSFDPSRVKVSGGVLNLSWDPTPSTVRNGDGSTTTYPYTAGVAHTGKGFAMREGFVEARIWVPESAGLWPAFWMLPTPVDKAWPPEIDIAEIIPDDTPDGLYKPHFNYHYKDAWGNNRQMGWKWYGTQGKSYAGSWHTYGLLREKGRLQVFLDGQPGPSWTNTAIDDAPMYVVLSSGVRKGYRPPAGAMKVDYLRAWARG